MSGAALPTAASAPQMPKPAATSRSAARDFEAVFLGQVMKPMLETLPSDGPFAGGHGETMFRGILAEEFGKAMAQRGGVGLAPAVEAQLIRMQEEAKNGR
jgi:Rod binding domain-containing protein